MNPLYLIGQDAPITRLPSTFPRTISEKITLGLDLGIGSCGQAIISLDGEQSDSLGSLPAFFDSDTPSPIRYLGVRAFDLPESREKTGVKLKNPERRAARLLRRVIRRRAQRMIRARNLLKRHGILPADYHIDISAWREKHEAATPWQWRLEGLSRQLEPWEWATSLLHFARHRGFRSNKKSDFDSKGADGGTLQSSRANHEALQQYQSVADMMLNDPRFADRIRNQPADYRAMVLRADLEAEICKLFKSQRALGNPKASEELESSFLEIFNAQNPLQHPYALLGTCPFEPKEKRGTRLAYSFELSRALQKLNGLTLQHPEQGTIRLADYACAEAGGYRDFIARFGHQKSISWKDLRKFFKIGDTIQFVDLPIVTKGKSAAERLHPDALETLRKDAEKADFVTRSNSKPCAAGSHLLRTALGAELWDELIEQGKAEVLDNAAFCLTFFESPEAILDVLSGKRLGDHLKAASGHAPKELPTFSSDPRIAAAIQGDFESDSPKLLRFAGTTSLSSLASRKLIPHLASGLVYSDACDRAGYQHTKSDYALKDIVNPIVASVIREVMKQVVHLIHQAGVIPGSICVELGRDLGKSIDERNETSRGIAKRTAERNENRVIAADLLGLSPDRLDNDSLLKYELWQEQSGLCPYCAEPLPDLKKALTGQSTQIDHILPRSRSHDNSFQNKVVVHTACNQEKRNQTPAEWLDAAGNSERWQRLVAAAQRMPRMKQFKKKRYLLNETFQNEGEEEKFIARNLNDTRYISKVIAEYLKDIYRLAGENPDAKGATRRIFVQSGSLTALVRRAWGAEGLKKDAEGNRLDDRHHAVDALICACLSEGQRQQITRQQQRPGSASPDARFRSVFQEMSEAYETMERRGESRSTPLRLAPPWEGFREQLIHAYDQLHVSRRESRKGSGSFHQDTFYSVETGSDGRTLYYGRKNLVERMGKNTIAALKTPQDLEDVKGIDHPKNAWLREALGQWIAKGSPTDEASLPRDPAGVVIRKVSLSRGALAGRSTPHGHVVSGGQVRLDVYSKTRQSAKQTVKNFYLVPIYTYHIREDAPPRRAIVAHKPEAEWDEMDETYTFEFSLWPNSLFEVKKKPTAKRPEGESMIAYYSGVNRSDGKIAAHALNASDEPTPCSVKQGCLVFRKLNIDRLGRISEVKGEKLTWRGKAFTSAGQPI